MLLNGSPYGFFHVGQGIHQWNPISSFLFIMWSEVLSRLMLQEECNGRIQGVKLSCMCLSISHLQFADDIILFAQANVGEATQIREFFDRYCLQSRQLVNVAKSSLFFIWNSSTTTQESVSFILQYRVAPTKACYLGLPLNYDLNKRSWFKEIKDQICSKFQGRRTKLQSQAGQLTLLRSVATTLSSYTMSIFSIF